MKMNGAVYILCGILKYVVASSTKAKLGALSLNVKEGTSLHIALNESGHKQPPTPMHCDNVTATGIVNDTIKKHQSRSMEMRLFWITGQAILGEFDVQWHPAKKIWPTATHNTLMLSTMLKCAPGISMNTTHQDSCPEHQQLLL